MTLHLGNVPAGTTIYVPFATYDGATGASETCSGLAVTDIEIYKNGSTTQRASDNGYTLLDTDGIDFDGLTGINGFSIDLSDNTDAGFYAVGSWYWVVVSSITADSQTVNFVAATFRLVAAENTAGTPVADAVRVSGTAQTARDIGASVLLSSGSGAGQIDLSSGKVLLQATQTGVTIPTVTTLTNLPTMPTDWLTAAGVSAGAVTELQSGLSTLTPADIRTAIGLAAANLDTQLGDLPTNAELATALAGADDAVLASIASITIPSAASNASAVRAELATELGRIDAAITTRLATAGYTAPPSVSDIWTTALTEAYRSTGATGTAAQLLYEILQNITEFAISGTTKTAKKLDGSTTAKTYTLNSATAPTSITEAT